MDLPLKPHTDFLCEAVTRLAVSPSRADEGTLKLRCRLTGSTGDIHLPPVTRQVRRDGLWQHTCFEAFLRRPGEDAYYEFNFAPSGEWAAYRFDSYRSGRLSAEIPPPTIQGAGSTDAYELRVTLSGLPAGAWQLGLAAVIEEKNGAKSYWALAHLPGAPDFHHPDCFTLDLPPPPSA